MNPRHSLAYHRDTADATFWSKHWAEESLDHLLEVARRSPLSAWLIDHLPPRARVLEAGCGLAQYVHFLSERGYAVTGVDYATDALDRHRARFPQARLVAGDLSSLPFDPHSFDAYVSLGVIEHYPEPPWSLLAEARRVLCDGGVVLMAVPYFNFSRRVLAPLIRAQERQVLARGGGFYQYALSERALDSVLAQAGFRVVDRGFYDPGRGLRDIRALLLPSPPDVEHEPGRPTRLSEAFRIGRRGTFTQQVLYARLTLRALAHMQIVCAVKTGDPPRRAE